MNRYPAIRNFLAKKTLLFLSGCSLLLLYGCSALTGIPGHGGGKRFAVEQELVSAATRSAIKQLDLSSITGKKVNIYVNSISDSGSGNIVGGKFSLVSQLHGDYIQSPTTRERFVYPRYDIESVVRGNTSNSGPKSSSHSSSSQITTTNTMLAAPSFKKTQEKGGSLTAQLGMEYKGIGAYRNSEEISSDDLQYLNGLLQTFLFLQGVQVVPPSEAEVDVYITVDVFGTVYTRVDWLLANNEILRAKTSMEVFAVETASGKVVMSPQSVDAEAEYNEQYILWAGPLSIRKSVSPAAPLLTTFAGVDKGWRGSLKNSQNVQPERPFEELWPKGKSKKAQPRNPFIHLLQKK